MIEYIHNRDYVNLIMMKWVLPQDNLPIMLALCLMLSYLLCPKLYSIYNRHKHNQFIYKFSLICRYISCVYTPMQSLRIGCKAMSHLGHINFRHIQLQQ